MSTKKSSMLLAIILFAAAPFSVAYSSLNNDPAALLAGQAPYVSTSGPILYGYVDYAVYDRGDYLGSLSFPDKYVYCYQIFNLSTSTPVSIFSVDLIPDTGPVSAFTDSASASGSPGGSKPVPLVSATMVSYVFGRNTVPANQHSTVLLFASDMAPVIGIGTITSSLSSNMDVSLPAPIPEPTTLLLFAFAVPVLVKTSKRRLTK